MLVDHLADSKSTIYKGVSQLAELGLIESGHDGLSPTAFGVVALERYDELARTAEFDAVLGNLPPDAVAPSALLDAEVVTPDDRFVDRHLTRVEALLRDADRIRGFSPAVSPETVSIFHRRIVGDEVPAELILHEDIVAHLRAAHPDAVEGVRSASHATLYRTDRDLPFTLLLVSSADGEAFCLESGDEGVARGLVLNDTAAGVRWAERVYEQQKRDGEPLP